MRKTSREFVFIRWNSRLIQKKRIQLNVRFVYSYYSLFNPERDWISIKNQLDDRISIERGCLSIKKLHDDRILIEKGILSTPINSRNILTSIPKEIGKTNFFLLFKYQDSYWWAERFLHLVFLHIYLLRLGWIPVLLIVILTHHLFY